VPNHLHLPADYYHTMAAAGLQVTGLYETGRTQRLPGLPMAIVLKAQRVE
jgi:hypothetical protein